ncbi:hypothetical protein DXG01_009269 [Tephrocybe rancida]|nr:hypothetical protein DXG01_009269 [Tephrocybe rancida]
MGMARRVVLIALRLHTSFMRLLNWFGLPVAPPSYVSFHLKPVSLRDVEHNNVVHSQFWKFPLTILESLTWLVNQSTNQSVTEIVAEASSGLLMDDNIKKIFPVGSLGPDWIPNAQSRSLYCFRYSELLFTCISSLEARIRGTGSGYGPNNIHIATWEHLIQIMVEAARDGYRIEMDTYTHFSIADHLDDTALCERILDWGRVSSEAENEPFATFPWHVASASGVTGARALLRKFPQLLHESVIDGSTFFHTAARHGNLRVVAAILEDDPSVISIRDVHDKTALEHAARWHKYDMVDFLLEQGSERPPHLLHNMIRQLRFTEALHLLDLGGWNPFLKDGSGESALEIANRIYHVDQGTLLKLYIPVEEREARICALEDLLDKMKLMGGEPSNFESIDNTTIALSTTS